MPSRDSIYIMQTAVLVLLVLPQKLQFLNKEQWTLYNLHQLQVNNQSHSLVIFRPIIILMVMVHLQVTQFSRSDVNNVQDTRLPKC